MTSKKRASTQFFLLKRFLLYKSFGEMLCFASVAIYYNSAHRSRRHWLLSWYKTSKLFTFRLNWNNVRARLSMYVCSCGLMKRWITEEQTIFACINTFTQWVRWEKDMTKRNNRKYAAQPYLPQSIYSNSFLFNHKNNQFFFQTCVFAISCNCFCSILTRETEKKCIVFQIELLLPCAIIYVKRSVIPWLKLNNSLLSIWCFRDSEAGAKIILHRIYRKMKCIIRAWLDVLSSLGMLTNKLLMYANNRGNSWQARGSAHVGESVYNSFRQFLSSSTHTMASYTINIS